MKFVIAAIFGAMMAMSGEHFAKDIDAASPEEVVKSALTPDSIVLPFAAPKPKPALQSPL